METPTRKKILFLITKSNWGGAQRYVYDLATNLDPSLYEVVIALGGDGELAEKLTSSGIRVVKLKQMKNTLSVIKLFQMVKECVKVIKTEKPDILHNNSSIAGLVGALSGRIVRTQNIVFTAHGWAFNEDRTTIQKKIFKVLHWLTVLLSHSTIAVSKAIKSQMNLPLTSAKMHIVHPGRRIDEIKSKEEARSIIETKIKNSEVSLIDFHSDIWVGTIAELHPIKQLERAIESVAEITQEHKNVRYIIIGDGQLRKTLQQKVKDLGLDKHVFFTGSIHEAGRLLKAFDIFVLPSKSESFGYVLIEAGLAELPVVATNVGGITDIITHEETGLLVEADNAPELTKAIKNLLEDESLRNRLATAHFKNMQEFSLEKMCQETSLVYSSIIDKSGAL